jgi:Fe-S oxidoreductase
MLTLPEKIIFALATLASLTATGFAVRRLVRIITAGQGRPDWRLAGKRLGGVLVRLVTFQPVFRSRFWSSLFHALVGWGFGFYILVNLVDVDKAYFPAFAIPGIVGDLYRLVADVLSVAVLVGMVFFVLRRFVFRSTALTTRHTTLLHPKARFGILRDSAIVAGFIILHVSGHFVGDSMQLAIPYAGRQDLAAPAYDPWQPFASTLAHLWHGLGLSAPVLNLGVHIGFWLALGLILAFLPYFPYSKHVHLFFAPLNFLLKPERRSIGELSRLNLDDPSIERFGVSKVSDLGWEQLMDAYACIMCYRCQDACPAYATGKLLSPAALEINKRYFLNGVKLLTDSPALTEFAIPPEAIWACTTCGACVDICPVNNEPMRDILDIRRGLVLMENTFPKQLDTAFRGMERTANPWGIPPTERMKWAEGLTVPTIDQNPAPEILWWVGCAPSTETRAQQTARAFAKILNQAGVRYAVLGQKEQCTGDSARRAGREDIFAGLAQANVEILNAVNPKRIVTTCPHCLHTLKNEYPAFGGNYQVIHHTQLIQELVEAGRLKLGSGGEGKVAFHDPCYLGRHNRVFSPPREVLKGSGVDLVEMPRHADRSFCCGAGGAQMWKEEAEGTQRVSAARLAEARATGAETLAVGCPFCMIMLNDAAKSAAGAPRVRDVAEIVVDQMKP